MKESPIHKTGLPPLHKTSMAAAKQMAENVKPNDFSEGHDGADFINLHHHVKAC